MKELIISKELISEVLGRNIVDFTVNVGFIFIQEKTISHNLNTYEFAFKCKEWAVKYNFQLVSWTVAFEAVKKKGYCQTHNIQDKNRESDKPFREDTEVEAIIKACNWILEQNK